MQACLDMLGELTEGIEANGFNDEADMPILTKLYGENNEGENWKKTLFSSYLGWLDTSICSEEERKQNGYPSPQKCKEYFLEEINEERERFQQYEKENATVLDARLKLESLRRSVPEGPRLDLLLRYEAALSRDIERTVNHFERRQRMRLGQSVQAPINVSVTASRD